MVLHVIHYKNLTQMLYIHLRRLGGNEANSSLLYTFITTCLLVWQSLFLGSGIIAVGLLYAPISPSIAQRCNILVDNPITSQAWSCLAPDATPVQTHIACSCLSVSEISLPLFLSNSHRTFSRTSKAAASVNYLSFLRNSCSNSLMYFCWSSTQMLSRDFLWVLYLYYLQYKLASMHWHECLW